MSKQYLPPVPCSSPGCEREAGHPWLHMSRSWNEQNGLEIIDEWGDVDATTTSELASTLARHQPPSKC